MTYERDRRQFDKSVHDNFASINSGQDIPSNIRSAFSDEAFSQDQPKTALALAQKLELVFSAAEGISQKGFVQRKDLQTVADEATNPGIKAAAQIAVEHYDDLATLQPSVYRTQFGTMRECNFVNRMGSITGCPRGVETNIGVGREQINKLALYADESKSKQFIADHRLPQGLGWLIDDRLDAVAKDMKDKRSMMQGWVDTYKGR